MPLRIGVVVGEISGDNLAVPLIQSLRLQYPDLIVEGVLGPKLIAEGGHCLHPMERLSVMGLIEPLARLPELFRIRRQLIRYFTKNPPDFFVGVDAPEFNLGLEKHLKKQGIPTVHYVSPSVWAWRRSRIHLIKKSVDLMLTLLPFETKFYEEHQVPVCFIGHPMADRIPLKIDVQGAREALGITAKQVVALMPGSRSNELNRLVEPFLLAARYCFMRKKEIQFVVPLVSQAHKIYFEALHQAIAPELPIKTMVGNVSLALSCADAVLVTSGTATLEVMLHKKPMVVAYRMHPLTYWLAKRLVKVPYIALPNLLANERLVPEYIQEAVIPETLGQAVLDRLSTDFDAKALVERFHELHEILKQDGSKKAANAIVKTILKVS